MDNAYGPQIPKTPKKLVVIGPTLPPHLLRHKSAEDEGDANPTSLPEPVITQKIDLQIEPPSTLNYNTTPKQHIEENYGPALPPHLQQKVAVKEMISEDNDCDEDYGPLPAGISSKSLAQQALEERALELKLGMLEGSKGDTSDVREKWMLELPEVGGAHLGLGPRQFRKNARPDFSDRSSWTDTPELKAKRKSGKLEAVVDLKKEAELREIAKRNKEKDKLVAEYNKKKKRDKSLLELHQEEIKKKKLEEPDASTSRRPFNREIDLKVNQFDDAQKKSILKKAMHLDDRFSRGQSKYL